MKQIFKISFLSATLLVLCMLFSSSVIAQNIVHIDFIGEKKGVIVDVEEINKDLRIARIENTEDASIVISIPTKAFLTVGEAINYRLLANGRCEIIGISRGANSNNGNAP